MRRSRLPIQSRLSFVLLVALAVAAPPSALATAPSTSGASSPGVPTFSIDPSQGKPNADEANLAEIRGLERDLRAGSAATFGGIWIDDDETTTVVASTNPGLAPTVEASTGRLTRAPFVFVTVDYALAELNDVYTKLVARAGDNLVLDGIDVAAIGINARSNRVELTLVDPDPAAVATLKESIHPGVTIRTAKNKAYGFCPSSNCPSPLKAGLKGYRSGSFACMMGFILQKGGTYYWATAGHCNSGTEGWRTPTETWQHPALTNQGSVAYHGWYNNSMVDISLVQISSAQKSNQLCRGVSTCNITSISSRQESTSGETLGQQVCGQRQLGTFCGTLHSYPYTIAICKTDGTCRTITSFRRATFTVVPGDSGGPVFNSASIQAIGSISSTYPGSTHVIYSQIQLLELQSGATVVTN